MSAIAGMPPTTFTSWVTNGGTGVNPELAKAFDSLVRKGYEFHPDTGGPQPQNAADALASLKDGGFLNATTQKYPTARPISTPERFAEYVFTETNQPQFLPEQTQKELALIGRLWGAKKVQFFSSQNGNSQLMMPVVKLWAYKDNSLWAALDGDKGNKQKVSDLEAFATRLGVQAPSAAARPAASTASAAVIPGVTTAPAAPPQAYVPPAAAPPPPAYPTAQPAPGADRPAAFAPPPVATAPEPTFVPPQPAAASPAAPPPQAAPSPAPAAAPPAEATGPKIRVVNLDHLAEEPAAAAPAPPPEILRGPNIFGGAVISPMSLSQVERSHGAKKARAVDDGTITIVNKEYLYMLPPGQAQLTKSPVPPTTSTTDTLAQHGVSHIYMNVFAGSEGKLKRFLDEHPIVARLKEAVQGEAPASIGISHSSEAHDKVSQRDFLFALPEDYDGKLVYFQPTIQMARALAEMKTPCVFIRLSGANKASVDELNTFIGGLDKKEAKDTTSSVAAAAPATAKRNRDRDRARKAS